LHLAFIVAAWFNQSLLCGTADWALVMLILGIETSCDETSVAVVQDGRRVLSNVICSQIDIHAKFGGIVPEVASRKHLELIGPAVEEAMRESGIQWQSVDGIAVTHGPGLVGSLLIGVATAKALAYVHKLPLIAINHLEGHIYANFLAHEDIQFPVLNLIVSGGHSDLVLMRGHPQRMMDIPADRPHRHIRVGRARDDAAGEAFDKVARALGLGFPGGPAIDRLAREGNAYAADFPTADLGDSLDFSFSGLKTAVFRRAEGIDSPEKPLSTADLAASFLCAFWYNRVNVDDLSPPSLCQGGVDYGRRKEAELGLSRHYAYCLRQPPVRDRLFHPSVCDVAVADGSARGEHPRGAGDYWARSGGPRQIRGPCSEVELYLQAARVGRSQPGS